MGEARYAMEREIKEQPDLFIAILENYDRLTEPFISLCKRKAPKKVLFVGNGSPYYAGSALCFAAERFLKADAEAVPAAIFNNHKEFNLSGAYEPDEILLVCPAESGHSRGQVDAARRAKGGGHVVMATTLNPEGVLARECDIVLPKYGEHEVAMAATKGQSQALLLILINFLEAGFALGNIEKTEYERYREAVFSLPSNIEKTIKSTYEWFSANEKRVMGVDKFFILAYGANFATAEEAALKFFECHAIPTFALELEESLHGPFRSLNKNDMAIFIAAEPGPERDRMQLLADSCAPKCDNRVLIASDKSKVDGDVLRIFASDLPFVTCIEYLIPLQILSYLIADRMGIDLSIPLVGFLDPIMVPGYED